MYKIIDANCFEGAYEAVARELKKNYAADATSKHIVLVPDKYSLTLEKRLMDDLNIDGTVRLQVQSFTRFAARSLKGKIKRCLTPEGSVMLLQKVVNDNRDELLCYKNTAYMQGFANEMYAAVTALRNAGVTPKLLRDGAAKIKRPSLINKLEDIALLYERYLAELIVAHSDSSTRLEYFGSHIGDVAGIAATHVYITDFYTFTKPQYDVIRGLVQHAASVTVGIVRFASDGRGTTGNADGNRRIYPENTARHLFGIAAELGIKAESEIYTAALPPARKRIAEGLYAYSQAGDYRADGYLQLMEYGDVFTEVEEVARRIRQLVIEEDYRYRDVAVVTGDIDTYMPVVAAVFERFDIPYFIDKKWKFTQQMPVRFLTAALTAARTGKLSDVVEFVKNPFFYWGSGLTASDVDCFENECLACAVAYPLTYDFFKLRTGRDARCTAQSVDAANKVKARLTKVLPGLPKACSAGEYLDLILGFLDEIHFFDKIGDFAERQFNLNESPYSKCTEQVEEKLRAILDEIRITLGEVEFKSADFYRILESMLDTIELALAPLYIDNVFIGMAEESRFDNVKTMFVIGATEGRLPAASSEASIISSADEEELIGANIALEPSKLEANRLDLFYLTQILIRPERQLVVSYPRQLFDAPATPSYIVEELRHLFADVSVNTKKIYETDGLSAEESVRRSAYRFATPKNAYYELLGGTHRDKVAPTDMAPYNTARALLSDDYKNALSAKMDEEAVETVKNGFKLFFGKQTTSVSQLERFFSCPLQHFFQYGLKLKQRADGTIKTTDTGTFIHDTLEHYFGGFISGRLKWDITEEEIEAEVRAIIDSLVKEDRYAIFSATGQHKSSLARLTVECVKTCKDLTALQLTGKYRPYKVESAFYGGEGQYSPISVRFFDGKEETELKLVGRIDRIDVYEDALYVIDYKSYKKGFDFKEVFYGTAIQLFVYLSAVLELEGKRPVGAFYLPVTTGYKNEGMRYCASGVITDDVSDVLNMDGDVAVGGKSARFPVKTAVDKKSGELIVPTTGNSSAVSGEQFKAILDYVEELVKVAAESIAAGYIAPRPASSDNSSYSRCDKCDFAAICPDKEGVSERKRRAVKIGDITTAVGVSVGGIGGSDNG